MDDKDIAAAREKLKQKFASGGGRIGGKGSVRRKHKTVHKAASMDDKRLQSTLKRLGVNNIPGVEEVNLFKEDGSIIHFENPKVQASIAANTYVVSGTAENKSVHELLPSILSQMGPQGLKTLTAQLSKGRGLDMIGSGGGIPTVEEGDEGMPDLDATNFEAHAGTE